MIKIIVIGVVTIFLTTIIKHNNPEISLLISVAGGILILLLSFDMLKNVISEVFKLSESFYLDSDVLKLSLKILGVGYSTEFVTDIAEDMGNKIISSKILFAGKVVICVLTLPIIKKLFSLLFSFSL